MQTNPKPSRRPIHYLERHEAIPGSWEFPESARLLKMRPTVNCMVNCMLLLFTTYCETSYTNAPAHLYAEVGNTEIGLSPRRAAGCYLSVSRIVNLTPGLQWKTSLGTWLALPLVCTSPSM